MLLYVYYLTLNTGGEIIEDNWNNDLNIRMISSIQTLQFLTAEDAMRDGRSPVIIDNTNIQAWEMKPYVRMVSVSHKCLEIACAPHDRRGSGEKQARLLETGSGERIQSGLLWTRHGLEVRPLWAGTVRLTCFQERDNVEFNQHNVNIIVNISTVVVIIPYIYYNFISLFRFTVYFKKCLFIALWYNGWNTLATSFLQKLEMIDKQIDR